MVDKSGERAFYRIMIDTRPVQRDMLPGVTEVTSDVEAPSFEEASRMAAELIRRHLAHPLLLAWYDRKTGKHSPAIC